MSNPTGTGGFKDNPQHAIHKGRPKSFDAIRKIAQMIGGETLESKDGKLQMKRAEAILRAWSMSNNYQLQIKFMEIGYGKVPDAHEITGKDGKPIEIKDISGYRDTILRKLAIIAESGDTKKDA